MQTQSALPKASLYFTEGGSDKEYHVEIAEMSGGNVVNFRYGRRGAALTSGSKTTEPVDFEKAKKIFDKLVKEKMSKGYTPDESGEAYQGTENAGLKTDFSPQLLNVITEKEAMRLIEDDRWAAQEKMDGERRAAHAVDSTVTGMNRRGLSVPLPMPIADEFAVIEQRDGEIRVDGEIIGDILYVFDLHVERGESLRQSLGWLERMVLARQNVSKCKHIKAVPVAITTEEKRALWDKVKSAHGEGIVFKLKDAAVKPGKPNSGGDWLKFKFVETASCVVLGLNSSKRSVKIGLLDNSNRADVIQGQLMLTVGNVSIPPNAAMPEKGNIIDVDYLYAYKGGSLYQPVFNKLRQDLEEAACDIGQLKYKPEGRDEDADDEGQP